MWRTKGQIFSKGLFGVLEFSQKMNEQILLCSKNKFVHLFFGRIRGYQKFFWNCLTFSRKAFSCWTICYISSVYISRVYILGLILFFRRSKIVAPSFDSMIGFQTSERHKNWDHLVSFWLFGAPTYVWASLLQILKHFNQWRQSLAMLTAELYLIEK